MIMIKASWKDNFHSMLHEACL